MRPEGTIPTMMRNPLRRYACYALASVVDLAFPSTDPRDAPTVRLCWRRPVRHRRRAFHGDRPMYWASDRQTTAERADSRWEKLFSLESSRPFGCDDRLRFDNWEMPVKTGQFPSLPDADIAPG